MPAVQYPSLLMTTRHSGGASHAPYDSFNLGDAVGDALHDVLTNRLQLKRLLGVRPVFMRQVHGVQCLVIDAQTPDGLVCDAVVTIDPQVACVMLVADCLPVLFWSESGAAVGAAHAGWRGLVGNGSVNILQATAYKLRELVGVHEPIYAWLGPCIGYENFQVGLDVAKQFDSAFRWQLSDQTWRVHLAGVARACLRNLGVEVVGGNDGKPRWCTVQNERDYFSHRRDVKRLGATGRMAACIWRKQ